MKNRKALDDQIENMVEVDALRASSNPLLYRNNIRRITEHWSMEDAPWRVWWTDPLQNQVCEIMLTGDFVQGDKYTLLQAYLDGKIYFYVFDNAKYLPKDD